MTYVDGNEGGSDANLWFRADAGWAAVHAVSSLEDAIDSDGLGQQWGIHDGEAEWDANQADQTDIVTWLEEEAEDKSIWGDQATQEQVAELPTTGFNQWVGVIPGKQQDGDEAGYKPSSSQGAQYYTQHIMPLQNRHIGGTIYLICKVFAYLK